jgi:signal peptidase I
VVKRVIGLPGDVVVGRAQRVYVNGSKADDIDTRPFTAVKLGPKQYFVLGDNRSFSQDSRDFGAVPRSAIFARVFVVWWPVGHFGAPGGRPPGPPPGDVCR